MSTHRHIDKICYVVLAMVLLITLLFVNAGSLGVVPAMAQAGYETRLFDSSRVHTIEIVMEDWDSFLDTCENEEYSPCSVVIDNEAYKNVGIRAKGNTSLSSVAAYGNDRYSFKIEFDCYENQKSYHGLDKISLNNLIQDNTYMKDYLTYQMMGKFGVAAPLCSYVYLTVNGEDWGLYLAVEAVEESFLSRNYGNQYGELYKPDSMQMGGGRGNGGGFEPEDMEKFMNRGQENGALSAEADRAERMELPTGGPVPEGMKLPENGELPEGMEMPENRELPERMKPPDIGKMPEGSGGFRGEHGGMPMGSDDVALIYSDEEYGSYKNIFNNAKTDVTDADKKRLIAALKTLNEGEEPENAVDAKQVIRYFVVHNFVCNFDSYTGSMMHNYYLYEEDGKLSMIPWDYNLAFGSFEAGSDATGMVNYPIDSPVSGGSVETRPMLAWILEDEEYTRQYHQYFAEFLSECFESGWLEEEISRVKEMIAPYVEKDPTKFCTYEAFETGIDTLRDFCLLRAESVRGQLTGTIPSTQEGQAQDDSSLVDASGVSISAMGSMNMGGKGGPGRGQPEDRQPGKGRRENGPSADEVGEGEQPPAPRGEEK